MPFTNCGMSLAGINQINRGSVEENVISRRGSPAQMLPVTGKYVSHPLITALLFLKKTRQTNALSFPRPSLQHQKSQ